MSAVVAQRTSPHMPRPASRNNSPMDTKSNALKSEEKAKEPTSSQKPETSSPLKADTPVSIKQPPDNAKDAKPASNAEAAQPLAPPPRPSQANGTEGNDYFSGAHSTAHYSLEPNLFEQSFGNPSEETPGKSLLPPIGSLTSPGNSNLGPSFGWAGSLRSGPLSPAMLSGPTGAGDYFDTHLKGSFPTPNESSLRTGLTPGGGGSMFPAPSPNSQAFINSLASGGATPSTLEFHRTAAAAAAANRPDFSNGTSTSQPARTSSTSMDPATQQATTHQHFGQHDNDAANGLFLLAQAGNESQSNNQFAVPNQPAQTTTQDTSAKRPSRNNAGSIGGSISAGSALGHSDDASDKEKPSTRKSKRASAGKNTNGRRKAEETPTKQPASKKVKIDTSPMMDDMDSDDDQMQEDDDHHPSGKKMTDEEKRKNFLERNRVAALKCRQRKKQWLANLQQKVEIFSTENDALSAQVNSLREEILNLKTILIAHKDCPITLAHSTQAPYLHNNSGEYNSHNIPYSMTMQPGQQVIAGPRRYS